MNELTIGTLIRTLLGLNLPLEAEIHFGVTGYQPGPVLFELESHPEEGETGTLHVHIGPHQAAA